jgi:hypothetical protein
MENSTNNFREIGHTQNNNICNQKLLKKILHRHKTRINTVNHVTTNFLMRTYTYHHRTHTHIIIYTSRHSKKRRIFV